MLPQGDPPEAFFQLVVEVVKVEALITLRDALSPGAHVPLSHAPRPSPQQQPSPEQPSTSAGLGTEPSSSAPMDQDSDDDDTQGSLWHAHAHVLLQNSKHLCQSMVGC